MGYLTSSLPMCPSDQRCSQWARKYIKYCLCSKKDVLSLALGLLSVLSWGVAEIPQILTNYKEKSTDGLSLAFLTTWIIGDLLNLSGCLLEPATLPTQYYMAILFTVTTLVLFTQSIYFSHIYHRLKARRKCHKVEAVERKSLHDIDAGQNQLDFAEIWRKQNKDFAPGITPSSPIPLPAFARNRFLERELYYTSARSLSRSHTPIVGFHVPRRTTSVFGRNSIEEPLLAEHTSTQSAPHSNTKAMLCAVSIVTIIGTLNLHLADRSRLAVVGNPNQGFVIRVGRSLLQAGGNLLQETGSTGSGIGTVLGWGMAAIYMGGRLPQILLNMRRGNVEGLNPLMFVFALVGNVTYVASILVSSMDWAKLRPNLPWVVDAGGCVILDTCIIYQFIYFHYRKPKYSEIK